MEMKIIRIFLVVLSLLVQKSLTAVFLSLTNVLFNTNLGLADVELHRVI